MNGRKRRRVALGSAAMLLVGLSVPTGAAASVGSPAAPVSSAAATTCPTTIVSPTDTVYFPHTNITDIAVDPTTDRVYLDTHADEAAAGRVLVLDGRTNRQIASIAVRPPAGFLSVDARADRIYVSGGNTVTVIDGHTNRIIRSVHIAGADNRAMVDPINGLVYVSGDDTNRVLVLSARTEKVLATIPVGFQPGPLTIDPRTRRVYVITDANISVINEVTNTVIATFADPYPPDAIAVDTWTDLIYMVGRQGAWAVADGRTNSISTTFYAGDPKTLTVDPNIDTIFTGNGGDEILGVCGHTNTITTFGSTPGDDSDLETVAVNTRTQQVYGVGEFPYSISIYDYSTTG